MMIFSDVSEGVEALLFLSFIALQDFIGEFDGLLTVEA